MRITRDSRQSSEYIHEWPRTTVTNDLSSDDRPSSVVTLQLSRLFINDYRNARTRDHVAAVVATLFLLPSRIITYPHIHCTRRRLNALYRPHRVDQNTPSTAHTSARATSHVKCMNQNISSLLMSHTLKIQNGCRRRFWVGSTPKFNVSYCDVLVKVVAVALPGNKINTWHLTGGPLWG